MLQSRQRQGIGGRLVACVEGHARAVGALTLALNVNRKNVQAVHAYEKHGFTVRASAEAGLRATWADGTNFLDQTGPALIYLESQRSGSDEHFTLTTSWVDVDQTVGLIHVANNLIGAMWDVARTRYLDRPLRRVHFFAEPLLESVLMASKTDECGKGSVPGVFVTELKDPLPLFFRHEPQSG